MLRLRSGSKVLLMVSPEASKRQSLTPHKAAKLCKPIDKANTVPLLCTPNPEVNPFLPSLTGASQEYLVRQSCELFT